MVNVPHNRNHRCPRQHLIRRIFRTLDSFFNIAVGHALKLVSQFFDHDLRRIGINRLVNGCHNPQRHQLFDNIGTLLGHTVSQLLNRNNFRNNNFFNNLFLRLNRLNRFRLFFLKAAPRPAETVIVIVVITAADAVQIDFSAPALRFKTPLHNFFAFLLKYVFAAFFKVGSFAEFFRRIFLFIFVIIIIF